MTWKPTPVESRIRARLLSGEIKEYKDLKVGDIFQAIYPDGETVHPLTHELVGPDVWARACEEPYKAQFEGWQLRLLIGSLKDLRVGMN